MDERDVLAERFDAERRRLRAVAYGSDPEAEALKTDSAVSMFARRAAHVRPVMVNGVPGVLAATADGAAMAVMAFTVVAGRIVEIDSIADPERLAALNLRFEDSAAVTSPACASSLR